MTPESLLPGVWVAVLVAGLVAISAAASLVRRLRARRARRTNTVTSWTGDELESLRPESELCIEFPSVADGRISEALRLPVVIVDGAVFVRDPDGSTAPAFQMALDHPRGAVDLAGRARSVRIAVADWNLSDGVDAAFAAKYPQCPELANRNARSSTLRVDPLSTSGRAGFAIAA